MSSLQFSLFLASTNNQRATFCDWQPITLNPNDTKVLATATSACQQQCTLTSFNSKVSKDDPITNCHKVYSQYRQIIARKHEHQLFLQEKGVQQELAGDVGGGSQWPNKRKLLCLSRNMMHHCITYVALLQVEGKRVSQEGQQECDKSGSLPLLSVGNLTRILCKAGVKIEIRCTFRRFPIVCQSVSAVFCSVKMPVDQFFSFCQKCQIQKAKVDI